MEKLKKQLKEAQANGGGSKETLEVKKKLRGAEEEPLVRHVFRWRSVEHSWHRPHHLGVHRPCDVSCRGLALLFSVGRA